MSARAIPLVQVRGISRLSSGASRQSVWSLRNTICRLQTAEQVASASAYLRNWTVAENIAFLARLDGHTELSGPPILRVGGAVHQSGRGTAKNHFAHVLPAHTWINHRSLVSYYQTAKAIKALESMFGRGVMAVWDWTAEKFPGGVQLNSADFILEGHHSQDGLVAGLYSTLLEVIKSGRWSASGLHNNDLNRIQSIIAEGLFSVWMPKAEETYRKSILSVEGRAVAETNPTQKAKLAEVEKMMRLQLEEHRRVDVKKIAQGATQNIAASTADERWRPRSNTF